MFNKDRCESEALLTLSSDGFHYFCLQTSIALLNPPCPPKLLNSSWCAHLEHKPSISLLIDPLKGHGGRQPTQLWMEVHVALRKDFCSTGRAVVPCMEKLSWGADVGEEGGLTFSFKQPLFLSVTQSHTLKINN